MCLIATTSEATPPCCRLRLCSLLASMSVYCCAGGVLHVYTPSPSSGFCFFFSEFQDFRGGANGCSGGTAQESGTCRIFPLTKRKENKKYKCSLFLLWAFPLTPICHSKLLAKNRQRILLYVSLVLEARKKMSPSLCHLKIILWERGKKWFFFF